MIWIGRPYGRLFNVAFLLAMLFAVCSMIGGVQQAQAQGPLGTLRDALRTNRELVQANRADAVAAREANVQLLRSSGGARRTLCTRRPDAGALGAPSPPAAPRRWSCRTSGSSSCSR